LHERQGLEHQSGRSANGLRNVLDGDRQIAGLVDQFGQRPGKIADVPAGAVQLALQMIGEGRGRVFEPVEVERFLADAPAADIRKAVRLQRLRFPIHIERLVVGAAERLDQVVGARRVRRLVAVRFPVERGRFGSAVIRFFTARRFQ